MIAMRIAPSSPLSAKAGLTIVRPRETQTITPSDMTGREPAARSARTPGMQPRRPLVLLAATLILVSGAVSACAGDPPPDEASGGNAASASAGEATSAAPDRYARPDPTAVANEASFGRWRPAPIRPSSLVAAALEAACRADPLIGDTPLAVLDARGEGLFTLVFAGEAPALCRATMADPEAGPTVFVRTIVDGAAPDAEPEHLGGHDLEPVDAETRPRNVLVGRVGDGVPEVSVNHDDATWTDASIGNGWYAVWWPIAKEAIAVAAVDRRNTVMDSYAP
jgi:hypothetical protein